MSHLYFSLLHLSCGDIHKWQWQPYGMITPNFRAPQSRYIYIYIYTAFASGCNDLGYGDILNQKHIFRLLIIFR